VQVVAKLPQAYRFGGMADFQFVDLANADRRDKAVTPSLARSRSLSVCLFVCLSVSFSVSMSLYISLSEGPGLDSRERECTLDPTGVPRS